MRKIVRFAGRLPWLTVKTAAALSATAVLPVTLPVGLMASYLVHRSNASVVGRLELPRVIGIGLSAMCVAVPLQVVWSAFGDWNEAIQNARA